MAKVTIIIQDVEDEQGREYVFLHSQSTPPAEPGVELTDAQRMGQFAVKLLFERFKFAWPPQQQPGDGS